MQVIEKNSFKLPAAATILWQNAGVLLDLELLKTTFKISLDLLSSKPPESISIFNGIKLGSMLGLETQTKAARWKSPVFRATVDSVILASGHDLKAKQDIIELCTELGFFLSVCDDLIDKGHISNKMRTLDRAGKALLEGQVEFTNSSHEERLLYRYCNQLRRKIDRLAAPEYLLDNLRELFECVKKQVGGQGCREISENVGALSTLLLTSAIKSSGLNVPSCVESAFSDFGKASQLLDDISDLETDLLERSATSITTAENFNKAIEENSEAALRLFMNGFQTIEDRQKPIYLTLMAFSLIKFGRPPTARA